MNPGLMPLSRGPLPHAPIPWSQTAVPALPGPVSGQGSVATTIAPFSAAAQATTGSMLIQTVKDIPREAIRFAGGLPSEETFPREAILQASQRILSSTAVAGPALQYAPCAGYEPLRQWIAEYLSTAEVPVSAANIQLVSGAQQALDMVGRLLLDPGDSYAVESPTYAGALEAWQGARGVPVSLLCDQWGPQPDGIRSLPANTKFVYLIPAHQNPTGRTIPTTRREELVQACRERGILVIEDDPYAELSFDGVRLPSMLSMDPGNVIHLGSFSKVVCPGLRVGYVAAPQHILQKFNAAHGSSVLVSAPFNQVLVHEVVRQASFKADHLPALRSRYAAQCQVMLKGLETCFPPGTSWTVPQGGMFIWVTLPARINCKTLLAEAIKLGVGFVPGEIFFASGAMPNTMRLNFVTETPDRITEGLQRLGRLVREKLAEAPGEMV